MSVFLDNNSTTPVDPRVIVYAKHLLQQFRANTSSSHQQGCRANSALEKCRNIISDIIQCDTSELIFTSCSTESNNIIIQGFIMKCIREQKRPRIMFCTTEHVSVLNPIRYWAGLGLIDIQEIPVNRKGRVQIHVYKKLLQQYPTNLVSISHVNNEVGTVQNIKLLCKIAHQYGAFFHTDATQSVGKIPILCHPWKLDSITWSSHKLYSINGAGGLTLSKSIQPHVQQIMFGNDNEHKFRPGSTDLFSILCMTRAMVICNREMKSNFAHLKSLTQYLIDLLVKNKISFRLNSGNIFSLNISFKNCKLTSDECIKKLSNVMVSKGSACKSRSDAESYVLESMGLPEITPTLRIGIGKFNTPRDIDILVDKLIQILK
jgi:cysteine desulfurase